ncbi:oxygenase MpaB family protein [Pseudonocardia sp.]|uniref:oxygenase MpaB family protein n=1 Tax=Pseudonocardia sp. TaxID=60912 RepID=UPI0031FCD85C
MSTTEQVIRHPERLINFEDARSRHGAKADFMAEMLHVGDPLADAVIVEMDQLGKEARQFINTGLAAGLDSLTDPPPAIAAWLRHLETVPARVDRAALKAGEVGYLSVNPLWAALAEVSSKLSDVYASPPIAKLLVQTGPLATMAPRRLAETGMWQAQTRAPGGLLRGAPGYVQTAQVRLLHARLRATSLKHGWDTEEWGVPINQVDVARTWLDFTVVPLQAMEKLGIVFSEEEQHAIYRYWWYIAYLLGLDESFYLEYGDNTQALVLKDLLDSTIAAPDENSRLLTDAQLDAGADILAPGPLGMDKHAVRDLLNGLLRYFHGDELADGLKVPHSNATPLIPLLAAACAQAWHVQRSTPEGAAQALKEHTTSTLAIAAGGLPGGGAAAYERHAKDAGTSGSEA